MNIQDRFGYWFAGVVDSKGYFGKGPVFEIKLRHDNQDVLERIKNKLGFGNIHISWQNSTIKNAKPQAIFRVSAIPDCAKIITILDVYTLQTKKHSEYEVWKQIVFIKVTDYTGPQNYVALKDLEEKLQETKQYHP